MKVLSPHEITDIIREGSEARMRKLAKETFSDKFYHSYFQELDLFIESASFEALSDLVQYAFSKPHAKDWEHALHTLIHKASKTPELYPILYLVPSFVLAKSHSSEFSPVIIDELLALRDVRLDKEIIVKVLSQSHAVLWKKSTHKLIKRANPELMDLLFKHIFNTTLGTQWSEEEDIAQDHLY